MAGSYSSALRTWQDFRDGKAGTIYTKSTKKNAEHGGMSVADINVALIVSNPNLDEKVIKTPVVTSQVAPTILHALGIDPKSLHSVRVEHTALLPGAIH